MLFNQHSPSSEQLEDIDNSCAEAIHKYLIKELEETFYMEEPKINASEYEVVGWSDIEVGDIISCDSSLVIRKKKTPIIEPKKEYELVLGKDLSVGDAIIHDSMTLQIIKLSPGGESINDFGDYINIKSEIIGGGRRNTFFEFCTHQRCPIVRIVKQSVYQEKAAEDIFPQGDDNGTITWKPPSPEAIERLRKIMDQEPSGNITFVEDDSWVSKSYPLEMKVKKLHPDAKLPTKAHDTDAGWDLVSNEDAVLYPHTVTKIKTNIAVAIPKGYFGFICDRSSMGSKGLKVNGGVVDFGYTNDVIVCLSNTGTSHYNLSKGDKIAQMVILPVPLVQIVEVDELEQTERGQRGFGSSGK